MKKYTSFMLRNPEELKKIVWKNRKSVVVFGHPLCKPCQKIMIMLPFVFLKMKIKWYTLNFCNIKEVEECAISFWITKTPTLVILEKWEIVKKIEDENDIFKFL